MQLTMATPGLLDPVAVVEERLARAVRERILLSHGHFDHTAAAEPLSRVWNAPVSGLVPTSEDTNPASSSWASASEMCPPFVLSSRAAISVTVREPSTRQSRTRAVDFGCRAASTCYQGRDPLTPQGAEICQQLFTAIKHDEEIPFMRKSASVYHIFSQRQQQTVTYSRKSK